MAQLSLVSLYGPKPPALEALIRDCLDAIARSPLADYFDSYSEGQIHGTLVGLERSADGAGIHNANLWQRGVRREMKLAAALEVTGSALPLRVRFGGFSEQSRELESAGSPPFERSFQLQLASQRVTLIGWPHRDGDFSERRLARLRGQLERECGVAHKYPDDNDLFLVLGTLRSLDEAQGKAQAETLAESARELQHEVRTELSRRPVEILLDASSVSLIRYEDPLLPPASTRAYPLAGEKYDSAWIAGLFD